MTGIVVYGGVSRVANICAALVPFMVLVYFILTVGILTVNYDQLPSVFSTILTSILRSSSHRGIFRGFCLGGHALWFFSRDICQ